MSQAAKMILGGTCLAWWAFVSAAMPLAAAEEDSLHAVRFRRPVASVLSADGRLLYVANQRSGSVSAVDTQSLAVVGESDVGRRLSALAAWTADRLVALDEQAHQLLVLELDGPRVAVAQRVAVSPYPVFAVVSADGRQVFVSSLWSRRITQLDRGETPGDRALCVTRTIDVPFAPRALLLVREGQKLIAADSFGDQIGVIDVPSAQVETVRNFPAHNIRSLGLSADRKMLVVAHQMLNDLAHSVRNDVHWGLLMSNDLRWLKIDSILDPQANFYEGGHMHPLGQPSRGGADPGGLAVAPDGTVIATLSGTGEVAFGKESDFGLFRVQVGRRPTSVVAAPDSRRAYITNTFDDSISVVDLHDHKEIAQVSLGPQPELSVVDRGELLFYDGALSHDGWMTCNSCHSDGHTNHFMNDNFSDNSFGAPKRVLSLLGAADTAPYAWNGKAADLATQIRKSSQVTMQGRGASDKQVEALVAFLQTLPPPPAVDALRGTQDAAAVARGQAVFKAQNCAACHAPPTYTTPAAYDVGLVDKQGNREFNPPSLRGLSQRGPYFHDNRATTLEDIFRKHDHPLESDVSDSQLADLIAFLRSL